MAFTPNSSLAEQANQGNNYVKDGIFVSKGKIVSATIHYNERVNPKWNPSSLVLRLEVASKGAKFNRKIDLFGDYKVEGGAITDEGSTFRVWDLIKSIAEKHDIDATYNQDGQLVFGGQVIGGDVKFLIDKELWYLTYAGYEKEEGGPGYRNFNRVFVQRHDQDDEDIERYIRGTFYQQVMGGWQKDYNPKLVPGGVWPDELSEYGKSEAKVAAGAGGDGAYHTFTADDDMPF